MSDEIKELAKRLRAFCTETRTIQVGDVHDAADALEAMAEQIARLTGGHVKSVPGEVSGLPLTPDPELVCDTLVCIWTGDEQYWHSTCSSSDELVETKNFEFCPSCGRQIKFAGGGA